MNPIRLFEFVLSKTYTDTVRVFNYQVPAHSRDEALLKIGQTFNNKDDDYVLAIVSG